VEGAVRQHLIETPRLLLRPVRDADIARLMALLNDWTVAQWLLRWPYPFTDADARALVEAGAGGRDSAAAATHYVIAPRAADLAIGSVALARAAAGEGRVDLSFWLDPAFAGRGYAVEAVAAAAAHAFACNGARIVSASIDPENERSQSVLERAGFRFARSRERTQANRRGAWQAHIFECAAPPSTAAVAAEPGGAEREGAGPGAGCRCTPTPPSA
jgi:RimJ/RimL family protein N-acetyltransferase